MRRTEQTLVDQMQINDVEIQHQNEFTGAHQIVYHLFLNYKPIIESAIENVSE